MNSEIRTPKLRFPEYTDEWKVETFSDIFERVTRKNQENNQNILTISAQHGLISQEKFFSKLVAAKDVTNYYLLHKNDYAYNKSYSKDYPMGAIKRLVDDDKGVVSTLYICFRSKEHAQEEFYDQYFESGRLNAEIEMVAQEGARNHGLLNIGVSDFFDTKLTIPKQAIEQRRIADFLTIVDKKIETLEQKTKKLEAYKQGVMQKIFTQKLRFSKSNGITYSEWQTDQAGSLFTNISNRDHNSDLPVLAITQDGGVVQRDSLERKMEQSDEGVKNYKIIEPYDFVISLRSFQGGIEMSRIRGISSPAYTVIRGSGLILPAMYRHYFKRDEFISQLNGTVIGIRDGKQISYGPFSTLKLPVPSIEEQQKIADFLDTLDQKITLTRATLEKTREFKKALLQRMFV